MSRIFIRHGQKHHNNNALDETYPFDSDITKLDENKARSQVTRLVETYGIPTVIYTSPYRRTIQTSEWFVELIEDIYPTEELPDIVVEPLLSEHFGSAHVPVIKLRYIHPETLALDPVIDNGSQGLHRRAKMIVEMIDKLGEDQDVPDFDRPIWFVTHGTVIGAVSKRAGNRPKMFKTLDHYTFIDAGLLV